MKRKIFSILLTFLLAQPVLCFAQVSSRSNMDIPSDSILSDSSSSLQVETEMPLIITDEHGIKSNSMIDMSLLLTKSINLEKGKELEVLNGCILKDTTEQKNNHDMASALISVICDSPSVFKAYISYNDNDNDTIKSNNCEISFLIPNNKNFSLSLKSKQEDNNCNLGVLGLGINKTSQEAFPMELTCVSSESISAGNIISPVVKSLASIALMLLGLF